MVFHKMSNKVSKLRTISVGILCYIKGSSLKEVYLWYWRMQQVHFFFFRLGDFPPSSSSSYTNTYHNLHFISTQQWKRELLPLPHQLPQYLSSTYRIPMLEMVLSGDVKNTRQIPSILLKTWEVDSSTSISQTEKQVPRREMTVPRQELVVSLPPTDTWLRTDAASVWHSPLRGLACDSSDTRAEAQGTKEDSRIHTQRVWTRKRRGSSCRKIRTSDFWLQFSYCPHIPFSVPQEAAFAMPSAPGENVTLLITIEKTGTNKSTWRISEDFLRAHGIITFCPWVAGMLCGDRTEPYHQM